MATVCLILHLALHFLMLALNSQIFLCPLHKQTWTSSWNNNHAFFSLLFYWYMYRISFRFKIKTSKQELTDQVNWIYLWWHNLTKTPFPLKGNDSAGHGRLKTCPPPSRYIHFLIPKLWILLYKGKKGERCDWV